MALGDKLPVVMGKEKGVAEGVATLGADGILAEEQRPSAAELLTLSGKSVEEALKSAGLPSGGFEGQALVKAGANSETPTKWGPWPSNQNLLINADFRQPVNRNGKSEYTASGWTIDKWASSVTLTLQDDYLKISTTASHNAYANFSQSMKGKQFNSKTVTVSILYRNTSQHQGEMTIYNASQNQWKANVYLPVSSDWSLAKITKTFKNTDFGNNDKLAVNVLPSIADQQLAGSIDIKAIKLELGSVQTLAHRDADGNWVLNDPPNYALQYALCSQYSPSTGEFVGSQHSNPNLLDNWYLTDPINQRGQTEYTGSGFGIDRWQMTYANCTLGEKGLTINGQNNYGRLSQQVEQKRIIVGEQYTFSVLVTDIAEGSANITMTTNYGAAKNLVVGLNSITFVANANSYAAIVPFNNSTGTATILAVKLELGPVQTLAHKEGDTWVLNDPPPNKALELAKCQRYYIPEARGTLLNTSYDGQVHRYFVPLPTTMRTAPTVKTITEYISSATQNNAVCTEREIKGVEALTENGIIVKCSSEAPKVRDKNAVYSVKVEGISADI